MKPKRILKRGMCVEFRNKKNDRNIGIYDGNYFFDLCDMSFITYDNLLNDNLFEESDENNSNIVKIWKDYTLKELLWERKEEYAIKEMVLFEPKITLKEFFESKEELAINCNTEEKANQLLKAFDKLDKRWSNGDSYLGYNCWEENDEDTCYSNKGMFGDIDYLKKINAKIYEFEEVDLGESI